MSVGVDPADICAPVSLLQVKDFSVFVQVKRVRPVPVMYLHVSFDAKKTGSVTKTLKSGAFAARGHHHA